MSWLRTLRPASFRGVQFGVFLAGKDFGRRVITHVFPQRDKPFHEDMGAHPRAFTIDAFIVGADVQAKAKRLEAALEAKGAGRLVHPYYGSINVVALRSATVFAAFEGRVARVSIAFEEAGTASAPTGILNTLASLLSSTGLVSSSILDAASSALALADQAMHIREAFAGDLSSLAGVLTSTISAFGLSPSVASIGSVVSVPGARPISVPAALERLAATTADTIGGGSGPLNLVQSTVRALALAPAAVKAFSDEKDDAVRVLDAVLSIAGVVPAGIGSPDVVANREALSLLVDASAAGAAVEAAAPVVWDSRRQLNEYGDRLSTLIDDAADRAGALGWDEPWRALSGLGVSWAAHVARISPPLPDVRSIVLPASVPSALLAYQLGGDDLGSLFGRAGSLARRNDVRHPGFLPAGVSLEVIGDA